MTLPNISGFRNTPKKQANGKLYKGRITCPAVQWTGLGPDTLATFTITADELADAAEGGMIWTDQDVQRGIRPAISPPPPREISLSAGYPDITKYVFDAENADEITEKILGGEKLFLSPLVWNLRPGHFEAYWDGTEESIHVYAGRIYLPDSHHRQQAICKAVRTWRESPREFPRFSGERQYKIELYFLSREDEGNYFFDKNQRPTPTAKSKAFDLTTMDDLSLLAKRVIDKSTNLQGNVNRVTDRLTASNPQVVTLSTLREMMKSFAPSDSIDVSELDGMAVVAASFYDKLAGIRPELGALPAPERRQVREDLVVDAAVMMHGYAALMKEYNEDLAKLGRGRASSLWSRKLDLLSAKTAYVLDGWRGDLFSKSNPLWQAIGVVKPSKGGARLTVNNTGGARSECGRVLKTLVALDKRPQSLKFLVKR
jgi:hypothetical protein